MKKINVTGIGPGLKEHMSERALKSLLEADVIIGYKTYTDLIKDIPQLRNKEILSSGMRNEKERVKKAVELSREGITVTLISSGDAGIYGMAGILFEFLEKNNETDLEVEVVPGISAVSAAAACLGAPLMNDFCTISLSDLMTDWSEIERRLHAAGNCDFVVALYNPKSKTRTNQIERAREILLEYKDKKTPVGIVRNAKRSGESIYLTTLEKMTDFPIDMLSIVLIGNKDTVFSKKGDRIITPRGYHI